MCSTIDAERHELLAAQFELQNDKPKAYEHYLEAASIHVLNAEVKKDDILLQRANACFTKAQLLQGREPTLQLSKEALAHHTLQELDLLQKSDLVEELQKELFS